MNLKKLLILSLLIISNLFSSCEYDYNYILKSDNEKIGTMQTTCMKDKKNRYKYLTNIDIKFSFMFIEYIYIYKEKSIVQDGEIISITIFENDDEKIKNIFLWNDDLEINFIKLDYLPFEMKPDIYKKYFHTKKFTLNTFEQLSRETVEEDYTLIEKNKDSFTFEVSNKKDKEIRKYDKNYTLIYIKNELFEAFIK